MPRTKTGTKSAPKTIHPKKRTKSVLVDIIEDEFSADYPQTKTTSTKSLKKTDKESKKYGRAELDELDQQKKFFSSLAEEEAADFSDDDAGDDNASSRRSIGLYRRFALKFVLIVAILASIVIYFSFSKLTVSLELKGETVSDNMLLKIVEDAGGNENSNLLDPRESIGGLVKEIEASVEKTYTSSGEEFVGEEISGKVRIINDYGKSQALVATTRLLSPDNKLFRIKEAVNIPAGGEAVAEIYVEKPSAELAIDPTTFIIPGLWVGLQDKIYAESDAAFTFQQKVKKYIKPSDLERSSKDIAGLLISSAKEKTTNLYPDGDWLYSSGEPASITIDAKSGDQKEEFLARAVGKIIAVSFSREEAAKLAANKLNLLVPDDKELIEFNGDNISYSIENYDIASKTATVKASFSGMMILKSDAEVIDRKKLINLTAEQIGVYLKSIPTIKSYDLNFFPSFIKKAPNLVDRIKIEINK